MGSGMRVLPLLPTCPSIREGCRRIKVIGSELLHLCRERQVKLVEVDLLWGFAEGQDTRKETLALRRDEIEACRRFFIGLLGERCFWAPAPVTAHRAILSPHYGSADALSAGTAAEAADAGDPVGAGGEEVGCSVLEITDFQKIPSFGTRFLPRTTRGSGTSTNSVSHWLTMKSV